MTMTFAPVMSAIRRWPGPISWTLLTAAINFVEAVGEHVRRSA